MTPDRAVVHHFHHTVVQGRQRSLQQGIHLPFQTHAIDHALAFPVMLEHGAYHVLVILQVGIDGDQDVRL